MQLGQSQALGILDDHQAGVGNINTHLYHRGRYQQICLAGLEIIHHHLLVGAFHPAVDQADG